jgi:hypothetical protein
MCDGAELALLMAQADATAANAAARKAFRIFMDASLLWMIPDGIRSPTFTREFEAAAFYVERTTRMPFDVLVSIT